MHKLPHLFQSRHGVYYLRLARGGQEIKRSLRTKDFRQAKLLALAFNLELAMKTPTDKAKAADFNLDADALKRLDVVFPDGTQVKDINTDDDVRRAKDLFGDRFTAAVPPLPRSTYRFSRHPWPPPSRPSGRNPRRKSSRSRSPTW
jgi:hypothetical protein